MEYKVGMISLGCNKNRVDSETALGLLEDHGYVFTSRPEEADILMVNTCGLSNPQRVNPSTRFSRWHNTRKPENAGSWS